MKKLFYSFITFFIVIIIALVVVANSSWVIKTAADKFAPDYKISYDDITGNVFTGIKILGLKYDNKLLSKKVKFSWNPSKILYKRLAINELSVYELDVNVVKGVIASFSSTEDNSSVSKESTPLPIVLLVDKIHLDLKPFKDQGVEFIATNLDLEDIQYANDDVSLGSLLVDVKTDISNIKILASLEDGKVEVELLEVKEIDSVNIEKIFLSKNENNISEDIKEPEIKETSVKSEEINPLIPTKVSVKKIIATLKSRSYKTAQIDKLELLLNDLTIDTLKIINSKKNAFNINKYTLNIQSDLLQVDILGNIVDSIVTLNHININKVDTLALQELFKSDSNESNITVTDEVVATKSSKEPNNFIPTKVILKKFHADILPSTYEPVNILDFVFDLKDVEFDVQKLLLTNGIVSFYGKTDLVDIEHKSKINNNRLLGDIVINPKKYLFEKFKLPIREDAIEKIVVNLDASDKKVVVNLNLAAKELLVTAKDLNSTESNSSKPFNLDLDKLESNIVYIVENNILDANTDILITTPYAKDISITNRFKMDENISYNGKVKIDKLMGFDEKLLKPLNNFLLNYSGDLSSIIVDISSESLIGKFLSSDFKKGKFYLETKAKIELDKILTLPGELNGSKVGIAVDIPLDFENIMPIKAKANINSNISNIDVDLIYGDTIEAKITSNIPKNSLLINFDKNVHWNTLSPLVVNASMEGNSTKLNITSKALSSDIKYLLDSGAVDGNIKLAGLITSIKGSSKEKININTDVNSIGSLMNSIKSLYTLKDLPPIEGALSLSAEILNLEQINLLFSSPKIIYHSDRKTDMILNDTKLVLSVDKSKVQLKSYSITYDDMKLFSTKPSIVNMKDNSVEIAQLWLNDQLKITGKYDLTDKKGEIFTNASKLEILHKIIDINSGIDVKTLLNKERTTIKGKIVILGGDIHYDLGTKSYPSDSDIIIVQDMKEDESSPFMDNLDVLIDVNTKEPLIYKKGPIDIKIRADLNIFKAVKSDILVLGEAIIEKGGSYTFEGKKFVLDKSNIYFTGDPNKPILDISVLYQSFNYLITIDVTGTPAMPNITFSSVPSLSREQILSIILFDSEDGAGTNSGEDMMKMMGGAMAKSALSNMGIKLDHIAVGTDGSMEVGKKLTDKIMVTYLNDEMPQVKVKYLHSPRLDSEISADEESQAYDIVYKRDFSEDDIVIFGR